MSDYFLYLMVDADKSADRFKIGISGDPYRRSKQLGCEIDLDLSMQIKTDRRTAVVMEKGLHYAFKEYNLLYPKYTQTEWFRMECFGMIKEAFESHWEKIVKRTRSLNTEILVSVYDQLQELANLENLSVERLVSDLLETSVEAGLQRHADEKKQWEEMCMTPDQ